jgi:hypothetical protein
MKTNMKSWSWMKALMLLCAAMMMTACDKSENLGTGEVEFEITDAPADDAQVKGVFVTVADVKVNGQSIAGFSGKQTINLMAYQEGLTKLLGKAELTARTYSNLTLVLDMDTDAQGNAPGTYVLELDNTKHKLATTASGKLEIALNKAWTVKENAKTRVVLDVDLRKAIRYTNNADVRFSFVGENDLRTAIRLVTREQAGTIKGTFNGEFNKDSETVIVYAYKKGTFNASAETQANQNGIMFQNSISSTKVNAGVLSNTYTLAFMEEGEYELIFATYAKNNTSGEFMFSTLLDTSMEMNGSVSNVVKVQAGVNVTVSVSVNGSV